MRIVFHGEIAAAFGQGFADLLDAPAQITLLPDPLNTDEERRAYAEAEVIVSFRFDDRLPRPGGLKLFHVPGAGYDAVDFGAVPDSAVVCNCFGHEPSIAEYVMGAMIQHAIPFVAADRDLRRGDWTLRGGRASSIHGELAGMTVGILGFGHIGKAVASRAKAFEMNVHVANRTLVPPSSVVDRWFGLSSVADFWPTVDFLAVTLPLTDETTGIVNAAALAALRPTAVVINVARGPIVEEAALYEALRSRRIAGAVLDTWYRYPSDGNPSPLPSVLPFHELPNLLMTPHMSGWTVGTVDRRRRAIADNVGRRRRGEPCVNVVREAAK